MARQFPTKQPTTATNSVPQSTPLLTLPSFSDQSPSLIRIEDHVCECHLSSNPTSIHPTATSRAIPDTRHLLSRPILVFFHALLISFTSPIFWYLYHNLQSCPPASGDPSLDTKRLGDGHFIQHIVLPFTLHIHFIATLLHSLHSFLRHYPRAKVSEQMLLAVSTCAFRSRPRSVIANLSLPPPSFSILLRILEIIHHYYFALETTFSLRSYSDKVVHRLWRDFVFASIPFRIITSTCMVRSHNLYTLHFHKHFWRGVRVIALEEASRIFPNGHHWGFLPPEKPDSSFVFPRSSPRGPRGCSSIVHINSRHHAKWGFFLPFPDQEYGHRGL